MLKKSLCLDDSFLFIPRDIVERPELNYVHTIVLILGLTVGNIIGLGGCITIAPQATPTPAPVPILEPESAPTDIELTAQELMSAYVENGDAANAKYRGKIVRMTGFVEGDWRRERHQ